MIGMRVVWERGPREVVMGKQKGRDEPMRGKRGGPIIRQEVVKRIVPKGKK